MKARACPLCLLVALVCGSATASPPRGQLQHSAEARQLLRRAIDLYVVGEYHQAAEILRPVVERRALGDAVDQQEALRTYGLSLFLSGARVGAERAFRDLLRLDPGARLNPSFVRPEALRFFEGVRAQYQAEMREVIRQGGPRGHALVNLIPPWGQFQNGHRTKAYILLSGEVSMAISSITTAGLLYSWRDQTGQFGEHQAAYRPLSVINAISFGLAAALAIYGIVDGLYYYYRIPSLRAGAEHAFDRARSSRHVFSGMTF